MTFEKWWEGWHYIENRIPIMYPVEKEAAQIIWDAAYEEGYEDGYINAVNNLGV